MMGFNKGAKVRFETGLKRVTGMKDERGSLVTTVAEDGLLFHTGSNNIKIVKNNITLCN